MKTSDAFEEISCTLRAIAHPARLKLLMAIGEGEACVCHLEALFGWRQAYISQHLMAMRKAGLLQSSRHGRFVYYRLVDNRLLQLIRQAAEVAGLPPEDNDLATSVAPDACRCPSCRQKMAAPIFFR